MAENGIGESLLRKNEYYKDCPGCKIEHYKETNTGVPFKHLLYVWIVVLCAGFVLEMRLLGIEVVPVDFLNGFGLFSFFRMIVQLRAVQGLMSPLFSLLESNADVSFIIRDFHVAKREEDIGYYAGYVGSAFMFGRALTSVLWGMIADRYGRKPVIMFGTISVVMLQK
ncbi:hypothetical protein DKX38_008936 [Salix brachista]|uniref:Major facilitator superfamily (MFS) profile domain-containing protein n=1 Tax=Salix brachista TaxID=2182728 RepID=A0A5N5M9A2_9ROSI|nr:hypothetical protein DKX38_008936 [Salix brachista]